MICFVIFVFLLAVFYCSAIGCSSSFELKSFFQCCILLCHHFSDVKCIHANFSFIKYELAPCKGVRIPESGNSGIFCLWNAESWVLESGTQLKESGVLLTIGIQNPSSTDKYWNPVPVIQNPQRGIQNPRLAALDSLTWSERTQHYNMAVVPAGKSDDSMEWSRSPSDQGLCFYSNVELKVSNVQKHSYHFHFDPSH